MLFESNGFPEGHPFRSVRAMPADVALPPIWLLGSSGYSAQLAAMVGAGFAFAHHFSDYDPVAAMLSYREQFKPSARQERRRTPFSPARRYAPTPMPRPSASPPRSISTSCAADAASISRSRVPKSRCDLSLLGDRAGIDRAQPRPSVRRRKIDGVGAIGTSDDATQADEVMVTTMIYDHAARRRSYELLAEAFAKH